MHSLSSECKIQDLNFLLPLCGLLTPLRLFSLSSLPLHAFFFLTLTYFVRHPLSSSDTSCVACILYFAPNSLRSFSPVFFRHIVRCMRCSSESPGRKSFVPQRFWRWATSVVKFEKCRGIYINAKRYVRGKNENELPPSAIFLWRLRRHSTSAIIIFWPFCLFWIFCFKHFQNQNLLFKKMT